MGCFVEDLLMVKKQFCEALQPAKSATTPAETTELFQDKSNCFEESKNKCSNDYDFLLPDPLNAVIVPKVEGSQDVRVGENKLEISFRCDSNESNCELKGVESESKLSDSAMAENSFVQKYNRIAAEADKLKNEVEILKARIEAIKETTKKTSAGKEIQTYHSNEATSIVEMQSDLNENSKHKGLVASAKEDLSFHGHATKTTQDELIDSRADSVGRRLKDFCFEPGFNYDQAEYSPDHLYMSESESYTFESDESSILKEKESSKALKADDFWTVV